MPTYTAYFGLNQAGNKTDYWIPLLTEPSSGSYTSSVVNGTTRYETGDVNKIFKLDSDEEVRSIKDICTANKHFINSAATGTIYYLNLANYELNKISSDTESDTIAGNTYFSSYNYYWGKGETVPVSGERIGIRIRANTAYMHYEGNNSTVTITTEYTAKAVTIQNASGGTVTASASSASRGSSVILTVTPSGHYYLKGWQVTAGSVLYQDDHYVFVMPTPAVEVTVTPVFAPILFDNVSLTLTQNNLILTATINGNIHPTASYYLYKDGVKCATFSSNISSVAVPMLESDTDSHSYTLVAQIDNAYYTGPGTTFAMSPLDHHTVKYFDGSSWQECIPFYWDGADWQECIPSYYNTAWNTCDVES